MSYILEALKKAEAEREQGRVPGLRSQAWAPNTQEPPARAWLAGRWWAMGLLLMGLAGAGLWLWRSTAAVEQPVVTTAPEARAVMAAPVLPPVVTSQAPMAVSPVSSPAPVASAATTPAPAPKLKVAKTSPPAPAAPADDRILKWTDMTSAQQQKLAKLTWGGAMHSTDPRARMVIINDQVMREGDALGPDLLLERIEPKSVVMNLQGQRIRKDF